MAGLRTAASFDKARIVLFVQTLYGVAVLNVDNGEMLPALKDSLGTSFATIPAGFGLDIKVTDRVFFRPGEFNVSYAPTRGISYEVSSGIVVTFGKK